MPLRRHYCAPQQAARPCAAATLVIWRRTDESGCLYTLGDHRPALPPHFSCDGVRFLPFITRPFYGEQEGVEVRGVRLILTDERSFRPVRTALALLIELRGQLGEELRLKSERAFAIRWGGAELFERVTAGATLAELEASFVDGLKEFEEVRAELLLY